MSERYWHGGAPGLKAGELIEPRPAGDRRHLRDGCPTCEARNRGEQLADDPNDETQIYVTTDREYARVFAAGYGDGALYRVEPVGDLTPTEDDPAPSWSCDAARVLSVYDALVRFTPNQARRALRRWSA
jgi:hypothetical protein